MNRLLVNEPPDVIQEPDGKSPLGLYDDNSPDKNFFNSVDEEIIRISGSEILLYKYYPSEEYDEVYMESKRKVYDTEPVRLMGSYDPREVEENLTQFGLEVQNDQIFVFNKSHVERLAGRGIITGDILKPMFQNIKYEVFEVQESSFEIYGIYHLMVHAKLLRDTDVIHAEQNFDRTPQVGGKL